jgi:hypothetical protein
MLGQDRELEIIADKSSPEHAPWNIYYYLTLDESV